MTTQITDSEMTSDETRHTARIADGGWLVTWLPRRALTRDQAITAMTIAETVATHEWTIDPADPVIPVIESWASELGITAAYAIAEASLAPEDHAAGPGPRDFALAKAIAELSPDSGPDWVRAIGPALGPAADAMEALMEGKTPV